MTERYNTIATASSDGSGTVTTSGLGGGSGQTTVNQANNYYAYFEFPIKWDDLSDSLSSLDDKKKFGQYIDDMSLRDNILEDYINTNVVNAVIGDSYISTSRASGVVGFGWQGPQFNIVSPTSNQVMQYNATTGKWFNSTVVGTQGATGPQGATGGTGPQGSQGPQGPAGSVSSGMVTATSFYSSDSTTTASFYQNGTYTYLGFACARVDNTDYVYNDVISGRAVIVGTGGTLGTASSSRRYKDNIQTATINSADVYALRPVTFDYNDLVETETDEWKYSQYGLIAEEVAETSLTFLLSYDENNLPRHVKYEMLAVPLLAAIKEQNERIIALESRITQLENI